jgi:hypothetical protein
MILYELQDLARQAFAECLCSFWGMSPYRASRSADPKTSCTSSGTARTSSLRLLSTKRSSWRWAESMEECDLPRLASIAIQGPTSGLPLAIPRIRRARNAPAAPIRTGRLPLPVDVVCTCGARHAPGQHPRFWLASIAQPCAARGAPVIYGSYPYETYLYQNVAMGR